jgi:cytochrome c
MRAEVRVLILVGAAALLTACGQPADAPAPADSAAPPTEAPAPAPVAAAPDPAVQAALAALPAPYNTADVENGQRKFALCRSCHTLTPGGANMTGPNLHGVFGRQAGTAEKFRYSDPVKTAGFTWDAEHLDKWLANPREFLPGNRMSFAGVKDAKDRADLIAYLMIETGKQPGG